MSRGGGTTSNVALASVDYFLLTLYRQPLLGTQIRHLYVLVHTVRKNTLVSPVMYIRPSPWAAAYSGCTRRRGFKNMLHLTVQTTV